MAGVAFDRTGNLFISDPTNSMIWKVDTSGNLSKFATTGLSGQWQIAFDSAGNLLATNTESQSIVSFTASGTMSTIAGQSSATACAYAGDGGAATSARLCFPQGVAVGPDGSIYIADTGAQIVRKMDSSGNIYLFAGTPCASGYAGDSGAATSAKLDSPAGVAVDASGNVYIADYGNNVVRKVDSSGTITTYAGGGTATVTTTPQTATGASITVTGVTTDAAGGVFIPGGAQIYHVDGNGKIALVAGGSSAMLATGVAALSADIGANAAALDAKGDLYVSDPIDYVAFSAGPGGQLSFASRSAGTVGGTQTATITNTGDAPLTISQIQVSGPFQLNGATTCSTTTALAAGASCTIAVNFAPTATGAATGTVTVTDNAGNVTGTTQVIALSGTATAALLIQKGDPPALPGWQ